MPQAEKPMPCPYCHSSSVTIMCKGDVQGFYSLCRCEARGPLCKTYADAVRDHNEICRLVKLGSEKLQVVHVNKGDARPDWLAERDTLITLLENAIAELRSPGPSSNALANEIKRTLKKIEEGNRDATN